MTATPVVSPHLVRAFFGRADGRAPDFALEAHRPGVARAQRAHALGEAGVPARDVVIVRAQAALVAVPQPVVSIERG